MKPVISLVDLGKKKMSLIMHARNGSWNLAASFYRKIILWDAMRKNSEESSQRK